MAVLNYKGALILAVVVHNHDDNFYHNSCPDQGAVAVAARSTQSERPW